MVIASAPARRLGSDRSARLRFGRAGDPPGAWAGRRVMLVDDLPAFEVSFWCGTCPFLFQRLEGPRTRLSVERLEARLADGLDDLDADVVERFGQVLPPGEYLPLLLELQPTLAMPGSPGDYFSVEQVATWGIDPAQGLPEHPRTPYYRSFETRVDPRAHLYEFLVPMVPPTMNDPARVETHRARLERSSRPTAVAVSTLDVCAPALADESADWYFHWGLTHFLLDGHHKLQAAAESDRPLRLLSLLSLDGSLASADDVARVPGLRAQPRALRVHRLPSPVPLPDEEPTTVRAHRGARKASVYRECVVEAHTWDAIAALPGADRWRAIDPYGGELDAHAARATAEELARLRADADEALGATLADLEAVLRFAADAEGESWVVVDGP